MTRLTIIGSGSNVPEALKQARENARALVEGDEAIWHEVDVDEDGDPMPRLDVIYANPTPAQRKANPYATGKPSVRAVICIERQAVIGLDGGEA